MARRPTTDVGRQDSYQHERRTLLSSDRVRELSQRRPGPVVRDTSVSWAIILVAWVLAWQVGAWWAIALAIILIGNRYKHACFNKAKTSAMLFIARRRPA